MEPNRRRTRSSTKKKPPLKALEQKEEAHKAKQSEENDGSPTRTSSPEPNCSICLGTLENKSFTDSCFHMFCFVCLQEWSKVKAECPLCKQKFSSIIHNVRSYEDYDQYPIPQKSNNAWEDSEGRNFHYRTTLTLERRLMIGIPGYFSRPHQEHDYTLQRPTQTVTTRTHWRRRRQSATTDFRRRIYINGLRVTEVQDRRLRVRQITPEFFRYNEACCHRLIPWLNRELNALLPHNHEHVRYVLEFLLSIIKSYPIRSEEFYQHVYPYIGRHTRHFMHEFESFAKSPYNMAAYDQHAVYQPHAVTVESGSDTESISSGHVEDDDDDVMIISPVNPPAPQEPPEPRPQVDQNSTASYIPSRTAADPMTFNDLAPLFNRVSSFLDFHNPQASSASAGGWDSPVPGPSWFDSQNQQRQETPLDLRSPVKTETVKTRKSWSDVSSDSDSSSSKGSDIVFMGYDKPWEERSPILLSSGSDEPKAIETKRKKKSKPDHKQRKSSHRDAARWRPHFYEQDRSSRRYRSRSRSRSYSRLDRRTDRRDRSRHRSGGRNRSEGRDRKRNRSRSISSERSKSQTSSSSRYSLSHSKRHRSRSESVDITGCCRNKHKKKDKKSRHKKHKHKKHKKHRKDSDSHGQSLKSKVVVVNDQTHEHIQKCSDEEDKEIDVVSCPSNENFEKTTSQSIVNVTTEQNVASETAEPYINVVDDQETPSTSPDTSIALANESLKPSDACVSNSLGNPLEEDNSSESKTENIVTPSENSEKSYKKHPSGHKKSSLKSTLTNQKDQKSCDEKAEENNVNGPNVSNDGGEMDKINLLTSQVCDTGESANCNREQNSSNEDSSTPVTLKDKGDTTNNTGDASSAVNKTSVIVHVPDNAAGSSLRFHSPPNNNIEPSVLPLSPTLTTSDDKLSAFESLSVIGSLFKPMSPVPSMSNEFVNISDSPWSLSHGMNKLCGENGTECKSGSNTFLSVDKQNYSDNVKSSDLADSMDVFQREKQRNDDLEVVSVDDEVPDNFMDLNWHVKGQGTADTNSTLDTDLEATGSRYHRSLLPSLEHLSRHFSQPCGYNPSFVQNSNKENPIEIDSSSSSDSEDEYNRPGPSHQTYTPPRSCVIVPPPPPVGIMTGFTKACPVVVNSDDDNSSDSSTCRVTGTSKSPSKVGYFLSDEESDETDTYMCSDTEETKSEVPNSQISCSKEISEIDSKQPVEQCNSRLGINTNVTSDLEANVKLLSKVIDLSREDQNYSKNTSNEPLSDQINVDQNMDLVSNPSALLGGNIGGSHVSPTDIATHLQKSSESIDISAFFSQSKDADVCPSQNTYICSAQLTEKTDTYPAQPKENNDTCLPQPTENTDTCSALPTENTDTCSAQLTENTNKCSAQPTENTDMCSALLTENTNKRSAQPIENTDTCSAQLTENTDTCSALLTKNTNKCSAQPTENTDTFSAQLTENTDTCSAQLTENTDTCSAQLTENTDTCSALPKENTDTCLAPPTENTDTCQPQPTENTDTCSAQRTENTDICLAPPTENTDICVAPPTENTDTCTAQPTENTDMCSTPPTENTDTCQSQPTENTCTDTCPPYSSEYISVLSPQSREQTDTNLSHLAENKDINSPQHSKHIEIPSEELAVSSPPPAGNDISSPLATEDNNM